MKTRRHLVVAILFCLAAVALCGCRSQPDYNGPVVLENGDSNEVWPILKQFVEDNYGLAAADKERFFIESKWSDPVEREGKEFSRRVIILRLIRVKCTQRHDLIDVEVQIRSRKPGKAAWRNAGRDSEARKRIIETLDTLLR